ncbi:MAG: baseplate J/gp47 family protein [Nanoarchaeota archaeon]|nr:baseplate J/gp47 family protein [Nanoarchaeota archaeon]
MNYGITSDGFLKKSLVILKAEREDALRAVFGEINVDAASVFGQMIGVETKTQADIWELLEIIYHSMSPSSAEGVLLDNVCQYTGITRLAASKTEVVGALIGDSLTSVPAGTLVSVQETKEIFETTELKVIDKTDVLKTTIEIDDVAILYAYTVTIDGSPYVYVCNVLTVEDVASNLVAVIDAGQDAVDVVDNLDGTFTLTIADKRTSFSVDISPAHMSYVNLGTPVDFIAQNTGSIICPANTMTVIETPVAGLSSVVNLLDGATGRDQETDVELRIRRKESLKVVGAGSVEAIMARLSQEVEGVSTVRVIENFTLIDSQRLIFDAAFVTGNVINGKVNGIAWIQVPFNTNHDLTAVDLVAAIDALTDVSCILDPNDTDNRTFIIDKVVDVNVTDVAVTGGASQAGSSVVDSTPPKSFEAVLVGGDEAEIAQKIWEVKPAGIETFGTTSETITDSQGIDHVIKFSRPVYQYAHVKVSLTLNPEEQFPDNGEAVIQQNILDIGNLNSIGDDIILQKFYSAIFDEETGVDGVASADIELAVTANPLDSPAYLTSNIPIAPTEIAVFDLTRIIILIL